ncbi:MAG: beta-propeller domain-containing protein, partial [Nanoarchaeota archaeon]
MKMTTTILSVLTIIAFFAMLLFTSCDMQQESSDAALRTGLSVEDMKSSQTMDVFTSEDEYVKFVSTFDRSTYNAYSGISDSRASTKMITSDGAMESGTAMPENDEYSLTNNQEAGVDEADMIKNDGNYIYTIDRNTVRIVKAMPAENATTIANLDFEKKPKGIFISDDRLLILLDGRSLQSEMLDFKPWDGFTEVLIYD